MRIWGCYTIRLSPPWILVETIGFHSDWKCINCPLPRNWTPWTQSHQRFNEFSWCGALPTTSVKITFLLASCAAASRIFSADLPLIFPPPLFTSALTTWHHNFFLNHIYNSNRHKKCHNYCQFGGKKQRDQIYQSSSKKSDFASASKQFFFCSVRILRFLDLLRCWQQQVLHSAVLILLHNHHGFTSHHLNLPEAFFR